MIPLSGHLLGRSENKTQTYRLFPAGRGSCMSRKLAESRFRSANRSFSGGLRDRFPLSVLLAFRDVFTVRIRFSLPPFPPRRMQTASASSAARGSGFWRSRTRAMWLDVAFALAVVLRDLRQRWGTSATPGVGIVGTLRRYRGSPFAQLGCLRCCRERPNGIAFPAPSDSPVLWVRTWAACARCS